MPIRRYLLFVSLLIAALASPTLAAAGTWRESLPLAHDGLTRWFRVYEPAVPQTPRQPVVFLLHGGGQSMREVTVGVFSEWTEIADEEGLLLIVPNGIDSRDGNTFGDQQSWNDCRQDDVVAETFADDVGFVAALIEWAAARYEIDRDRIYATGASNGGMMSYRLAFELGHRIAAIAPFIANLPAVSECDGPAYPIPVMIVNGDAETYYMPWEGGCVADATCARGSVISAEATREFWLAFLRTTEVPSETFDFPDTFTGDGSTVTRFRYDGGVDGTEVIFHRVRGGGHSAPTIEHPFDPLTLLLLGLGRQNRDMESAREVWAFFERHTLRGTGGGAEPGETGTLRVDRGASPGTLQLTWDPDCGGGTRYGVYRGDLSVGFASLAPEPGLCSQDALVADLPEGPPRAEFFLVVPNDGASEGDFGASSAGIRRTPPGARCFPAAASNECALAGE